jgi:hypothetical protein
VLWHRWRTAHTRNESRNACNTIFNDLLKQEPTRKWPLSNCFSPRTKLFSLYGFDLKAIESSILFAGFRPLRTPVPKGLSSHFSFKKEGKDEVFLDGLGVLLEC